MLNREANTLAEKIGNIFNPINKKICSNCPKADEHGENDSFITKEQGCCSKCYYNEGYFRMDAMPIVDKTILEKLKIRYNFEKPYGFFDNVKKECKLPRQLRSHTCLGYYCDAVKKFLGNMKVANMVYKFIDIRGKITENDILQQTK